MAIIHYILARLQINILDNKFFVSINLSESNTFFQSIANFFYVIKNFKLGIFLSLDL